MSIILDALKKSENDRQRQSGPALFEVKVAAPRTGLPVWAIAIVVLLGVNLLIVAWMMLRRPAQPPSSTASAQPPVTAPATSPANYTPGPPPQVGPGQYGPGQYPNPQYANANGGQYPNGQYPNGQYPNGPNGQYPNAQYANGGAYPNGQYANGQYVNGQYANGNAPGYPGGPQGQSGGGQPGSPGAGGWQPGAPGQPTGGFAGQQGGAANQQTMMAAQQGGGANGAAVDGSGNPDDYAPAADGPGPQGFNNRVKHSTEAGLPLYSDAAAAAGAGLPQLRLDLHVFAAKPQDRFVMINMRKFHEGDTLPEGVRVDSITPEGAVLSHNGSRYLLPRD
jgi:hypothetical protein